VEQNDSRDACSPCETKTKHLLKERHSDYCEVMMNCKLSDEEQQLSVAVVTASDRLPQLAVDWPFHSDDVDRQEQSQLKKRHALCERDFVVMK